MLEALSMSEVRCIHYAGTDPDVLCKMVANRKDAQSTKLAAAPTIKTVSWWRRKKCPTLTTMIVAKQGAKERFPKDGA